MKIPFRPLGKVRELLDTIGFEVAYAYDDLVFSDHSMFILRFDDEVPEKMYLYFNSECIFAEAKKVSDALILAGKVGQFKIINSGHFDISQAEDREELAVKFFEKK